MAPELVLPRRQASAPVSQSLESEPASGPLLVTDAPEPSQRQPAASLSVVRRALQEEFVAHLLVVARYA